MSKLFALLVAGSTVLLGVALISIGSASYSHPTETNFVGQNVGQLTASAGGNVAFLITTMASIPNVISTPDSPGISGGSTCRDGTHSNSTGRGTCSHHGGVRQ